MFSELRQVEDHLYDGIHIARVAKIFHSCKTWSEDWHQSLSFFEYLWQGKIEVCFKIHLCNRLLCLCLSGHVDAKDSQVLPKSVVKYIFITPIAVNWSGTFCRDRSQLYCNGMSCIFEMLNSMIVTTGAIIVSTSATKISSGQTKP